jgi:hypothetical protein
MRNGPTQPASRAAAKPLEGVNERLAEMIETLRKGREKLLTSRPPGPLAAPLPGTVAAPEPEAAVLRRRIQELEDAQARTCDELVLIEAQLTHFTGMFAVLRQLHEAGTRGEVLQAIQEIVVNLVGSEEVAILEVGPGGELAVARLSGVDLAEVDGALRSTGFAEVARSEHVLTAPDRRLEGIAASPVTAVVPLRAGADQVGAVVVFRMLGHKPLLRPRDLELLELLQLHAAVALRATAPTAGSLDVRS